MLKSFKKFLSVFLTILMIISGIPTSVYANEINNKLDEEAINNIVSAQSNENSDKIAAEIRENRTENSKTYLMDDGTYCDVVSAVPIHEFIENKWENVDKNLDGELPETLEESCYLLQAQSSSSLSLSSNENIFTDNNETFLINQLDGNARYGNSISNFGVKLPTIKRGNALIKINSINNYLSQNKIVLSANLNMQYSNLTANMLLKAYEEKNEWDITTNQLSINTTELRLLDYVNINTNNITNSISLDITDSYCRWEKGVVENNGIILNTNSRAQVDFNNICIIVQYKKVSELDSNFTYHEKDMGITGSIYINDFTSTPTIKMNIVEGDATNNFDLQLIYNAAVLDQNSSVLPYTKTNYDSRIELNGNTLTWIMPNGDIKTFTQPGNAETINNFQTWQENIIAQNLSVLATVNIDQEAIDSEGDNTVYDSITIDYSGYIFEFNEQGFLNKINIGDNAIIIKRGTYGISRITDLTGRSYYFYYANYNNGQKYLHRIVTKSADNILLDERTISLTQENGNSTFIFNFSEDAEPNYTFDSNGRIIRVSKDDSNYIDFDYTNIDNSKTLEKYTFCTGVDVETLDIDSSETFQRTFALNDNEELFQYDRLINLITYRNSDNPYTCATYDGNELINTYSFKNVDTSKNLIKNSSFDEELVTDDDASWMIMGTTSNTNDIVDPNDSNNKVLSVEGSLTKDNGVMQYIMDFASDKDIMKADQTYILTCEGIADTAIPTENRFFGVELEVYSRNDELIEVITMPFDTCVSNKLQFRMVAFKLEQDAYYAAVKLIYSDQDSTAYFDNVGLYEGQALTDVEAIGGSSIYLYEKNGNGQVISEYMTDGNLTLRNDFDFYNENQKLKSVKDLFRVKTEYEYIGNKTIERVKSDSSENPIDIYYKEIQYSNGLISQVSTTIKNILNNADISIMNSYTYNSDKQISSINHNGIVYDYDYSDGLLTGINMHQAGETDSSCQNLITYEYSGKFINSIIYANGWRILYTLDNEDNPITIEYHDSNNTVVKSYIYTYDNSILKSVYDSISGLKYVFMGDGCYEIYQYEPNSDGTSAIDNHPIKFYAKETLENGDVKHTYYRPTIEGVDSDTGLSTTTIGGTIITDSALGRTKSSEINISKLSVATSNEEMLYYNYQRSSQRDYFGRLTQKQMDFTLSNSNHEEISQNSTNCTYEYYTDESNITYNLPEYYNYAITNPYNNTTSSFSLRLKFEYDEKGNLNYVYQSETLSDGTMSEFEAVKRYEYDTANQLILEIDLLSNTYAKYTYDAGMNLTSKVYFDFDSSNIDITAENPQYYGTPHGLVFDYINDRLISISEYIVDEDNSEESNNEHESYLIQYDDLGNPLNYIGYGAFGDTRAELKWMGNNLVEYSTENYVFKYSYDANGYRIYKEMYERKSNGDLELNIRFIYVWDNGILTGFIFNNGEFSLHTDIIYDQEGVPAGIVTPAGIPYYFVYDNNGNITEMVNIQSESICSLKYDSFGTVVPTIYEEGLNAIVPIMTLMFLPCTYHGCIYDFESGFYFNKGRCYSPTWGRYLNPEYTDPVSFDAKNMGASNFYLYCNNNSVNNFEEVGIWSRDYRNAKLFGEDFAVLETGMSLDFLSRPFCAIYANEIIRHNGEWTLEKGNSYKGLNVIDIAATLFAKSTGNYAMAAVNKVNASWGDGWIQNNSNSSTIKIYENDPNIDKYIAIWYRAEDIRNYAILDGIIITL